MAFAQMTFRESLQDIEAYLRAQKSKLYHMGIRSTVSRNTVGKCQPNPRSAHIRRICPNFDPNCTKTVNQRRLRLRIRKYCVRAGLFYHRPFSKCISLGPFPAYQSWDQTSYTLGSARQHSNIYSYHRR